MKKPKPDELIVVEIVRKDGSPFVAHVVVSVHDNATAGPIEGSGAAAFHTKAAAVKVQRYLSASQFKTRLVLYRKVRA